jgi:hypothetical protein
VAIIGFVSSLGNAKQNKRIEALEERIRKLEAERERHVWRLYRARIFLLRTMVIVKLGNVKQEMGLKCP